MPWQICWQRGSSHEAVRCCEVAKRYAELQANRHLGAVMSHRTFSAMLCVHAASKTQTDRMLSIHVLTLLEASAWLSLYLSMLMLWLTPARPTLRARRKDNMPVSFKTECAVKCCRTAEAIGSFFATPDAGKFTEVHLPLSDGLLERGTGEHGLRHT